VEAREARPRRIAATVTAADVARVDAHLTRRRVTSPVISHQPVVERRTRLPCCAGRLVRKEKNGMHWLLKANKRHINE